MWNDTYEWKDFRHVLWEAKQADLLGFFITKAAPLLYFKHQGSAHHFIWKLKDQARFGSEKINALYEGKLLSKPKLLWILLAIRIAYFIFIKFKFQTKLSLSK